MLGAEWKALPESQKQPYIEKYEKLKVGFGSNPLNEFSNDSNITRGHSLNSSFDDELNLKMPQLSGRTRQSDGEVDGEDDSGRENVRDPGSTGKGGSTQGEMRTKMRTAWRQEKSLNA